MRRTGFSLLELTVVLLIMAIVASAVVLNTRGPMHNARADEIVARIGEFDRLTRSSAQQQDIPLRLVVDIPAGTIRRVIGDDDENFTPPLTLPSHCRIDAVRIGERRLIRGSAVIECSRQGITPSYAIHLIFDDDRSVWLLVAGLTGQFTTLENETELQDIWQATGGSDAG